jgi:hypothetical protein
MARFASALVLTLSVVVAASPRASAEEIWGETTLSGGAAAARHAFSLGSNDGRFDAEWIVDLIRRNASIEHWSAVASKVARYATTMDVIARAAAKAPGGIQPPAAGAAADQVHAFRDLAAALGIDARVDRRRWQLAVSSSAEGRERATWAAALGLRVDDVVSQWSSGQVVKIDVPIARLPVPLPAYWRGNQHDASVTLAAIVRDRQSALLYAGLMALDDETLTWLDQHRRVIDRLRDHVPVFAAFARSIRIRGGVADVPGGIGAARAWQALIGRPPSKPEAFFDALTSDADGGRLHFFDAVMYAPATTQEAIVGRAIARPASLTAIFQAFHGATTGWAVEKQPFARPLQDPAWALALVDLHGDSLSGPAWLPSVLARASARDTWPSAPKALPSTLPSGDIEWIVRWLFDRPDDMLARVRLLRFSQRFVHVDDASPADVETALRTFRDLPSLALTLERMGVHDPALIARVGRAAYALSRSGDRAMVVPVLERWQTCLALIEQTSRLRPIPPPDIARLVSGLADAASQPVSRVTDALLRWLTTAALPTLDPSGAAAEPFDADVIVRAIAAGRAAAGTRITWEGLTYERNPLRVALRDLDGLLPIGSGMKSGTGRTLAALYERASGAPRDARNIAADLDALRTTARKASSPLAERFDRDLIEGARALRSSRGADAARKSALLQIPEISEMFGAAEDLVIRPVVYGLAMTPLHQSPALQSEAWSFHQLVPASAVGGEWWRAAWQPATAQVRDGGGSAMVGSWLLLDLALADAIMPRRFDQASLLAPPVRDAMTHDVAVRAHAGTAAGAAGAADRIASGRRVLAAWRQTPPERPAARRALENAGISRLRVNLALWTAAVDPARVEAGLTMAEMAGLGDAGSREPIRVAMETIDGCICLAPAPPWPVDDIRAYWPSGTMAAVANDLALRLAEGAKIAGVPAIVVGDLLPLAAGDWIARTDPYANDDWESLTLWPKQLDADAIDAYLMQLVSTGVLAPIEEAVP